MAVTAKLYGLSLKSMAQGKMVLDSDTLKVMLCTSTYTPNQDTHQFKSDVTNEITGTGYTAGGAALASVTLTYNSSTNTLTLDAADTTWTGSTLTARYAVVYDDTPATDATKPLIGYVDFGADQSDSAGTFTITWDATGVATWTVA